MLTNRHVACFISQPPAQIPQRRNLPPRSFIQTPEPQPYGVNSNPYALGAQMYTPAPATLVSATGNFLPANPAQKLSYPAAGPSSSAKPAGPPMYKPSIENHYAQIEDEEEGSPSFGSIMAEMLSVDLDSPRTRQINSWCCSTSMYSPF